MAELKKKIFYGVALTISRFFFPIITYPYVSRVLGPDKIGLLNFSESYANYFILVAALGIPLYGVREVAKVKHNQFLLNKVSTEIAIVHLISSLLLMIVFFLTIIGVDQFRQEWMLNTILGMNILISFISLEWIFIGIEKFKFVTIRSIVTRLLPVFLIFVFVKDESDYLAFQILNTLAFLLNALLNLWFLRYYVKFSLRDINVGKHSQPLISIFFSSVFIQFYAMMDSVMLGFISGYKSVGIYSAASKLNRILCVVIASIGNVLVPRISNLISLGEKDKSMAILNKSLKMSVAITLPLAFGFFLLSSEIISIMYGVQFSDSVVLCRILSPIIILAGITNVYTIQFLLPHSGEKELFVIYLAGTLVTVVLNGILIFFFDSLGAAVAMLTTELVICIFSGVLANRRETLLIPWKYFLFCFLFCVAFWPIIAVVKYWTANIWGIVILSLILCGGTYSLLQLLFFRKFVLEEFYSLINRKQL